MAWEPYFHFHEKRCGRCQQGNIKSNIAKAVNIPVIAIGGIGADNILSLQGSGICGIAVVSAIFAAKDIEAATKALKDRTEKMLK